MAVNIRQEDIIILEVLSEFVRCSLSVRNFANLGETERRSDDLDSAALRPLDHDLAHHLSIFNVAAIERNLFFLDQSDPGASIPISPSRNARHPESLQDNL